MTTHAPVPADVEPDSILSLVEDCREISGVLGSFVPTVITLPEPRQADLEVQISDLVAAGLDGYDEYGS